MDKESLENGVNNYFPGKIAVITTAKSVRGEDYNAGERLLAKYGAGKLKHLAWPVDVVAERQTMFKLVSSLADDPDIKAIIINQAVEGTNLTMKKLRETRDDIFIVYGITLEPPSEAAVCANLVLFSDIFGMGPAVARQAIKQGAKAFVHYSFPRHLAMETVSARRDLLKDICTAEGIVFIDAIAPDPREEAGEEGTSKFILDDVPGMVAKYGEDTVFFGTNCHMQIALIKAVIESHAILAQTCCPSPFHGFPEAMGIMNPDYDLKKMINRARIISREKNMNGRLSTWPVSAPMMYTAVGAEYAIRWLREEVPKNHIDGDILLTMFKEYIGEVYGKDSNIFVNSYVEKGITYDNFKLIRMSYLDF